MTELQEREIGARLDAMVSGVDVPRVEWDRVRGRVVGLRRRRRRVRAARVGAGVLTVVALAGGVQAGVLPYPAWGPAVSLDLAASGPSALAQLPTRGSLADDDAWLAAFRERVASERTDESGGESWQVPSADDVAVVFAGDVEGQRVAAVEAPYRWGVVESRQQVWFMGPVGADAEEMVQNGNGDVGDVMATQFGGGTGGWARDTGPAGVLVVGARATPLTVVEPPVLQADGTTTRERTEVEAGPNGVTTWLTHTGGTREVEVDGRSVLTFGSSDPVTVTPSDAAGALTRADAESAAAQALGAAGLGALPAREVWASGAGEQPFVLSLDARSGARLLVMARTPAGSPFSGTDEQEPSVDALRVLPAGVDIIAAWRVGTSTWREMDDDSGPGGTSIRGDGMPKPWYRSEGPSNTTALVGPETATSAELRDADGAVLDRVPLVDGGTTTDVPGVASVRFVDADGAEVGATDVVGWTAEGAYPDLS